jgi:hypothetical protein
MSFATMFFARRAGDLRVIPTAIEVGRRRAFGGHVNACRQIGRLGHGRPPRGSFETVFMATVDLRRRQADSTSAASAGSR